MLDSIWQLLANYGLDVGEIANKVKNDLNLTGSSS